MYVSVYLRKSYENVERQKNNTTKNYLSILIGNERYIFECKLNIIECHNE